MNWKGLIIFVLGLAAALSAGWLAFPKLLYEARQQPLNFSHKVHAEKAGSACDDCHAIGGDGRFAGIPTLESCAACHAEAQSDSADEKRLVEEYVKPGKEIPWLVYSRQPDNVYFSHATHVKVAKLTCQRCHGDQGKSDRLRPYEQNRISTYSRDIWGYSISRLGPDNPERPAMKMDDCVACHREKGVDTSCIACHK
jgi:menaquinone reductase, multiheme cytochrome c subunit